MFDNAILLTPQEAAEYLGGDVTPRKLYQAGQRGELPCVKLAGKTGRRHYTKNALDLWVARHTVDGAA